MIDRSTDVAFRCGTGGKGNSAVDTVRKSGDVYQGGGGSARLMYETLTGEADRYFLQLDLTVYKRKKSIGLLAWNPDVRVDCSGRSERTAVLEEWAADNYLPVQAQLQQQLKACEQKVLAELPNLLAN